MGYAVAIRTTLRVEGPGVITQIGTRVKNGRRVMACLVAAQTVEAAGTVVVTCRLNRRTRLARGSSAQKVRIVTRFTPTDEALQSETKTVTLPRRPVPPQPVTG